MQREMYFENLEVANPPHDKLLQEHANHEHTEALQPRLSLAASPSSSPIPTTTTTILKNHTTLDAINTTLSDINQTTCINTASGFLNSSVNSPNITACLDSPIATTSPNGFLNTTNSPNATSPDATTGISPTTPCINSSTAALITGGFQETTSSNINSCTVKYSTSSSPIGLEALDSVGLKRKRDWMNSLTPPQLTDSHGPGNFNFNYKGKNNSSLNTSVRISNGSITFPAGWEQYLDLQTGETYYVNWNTRTKHCKVQCPEVQRCLAGALNASSSSCGGLQEAEEQQQLGTCTTHINYTSNMLKLIKPTSNVTVNKKDTIEDWLSKMSATTSALVNNQSSSAAAAAAISKRPPLAPFTPSSSTLKPPSCIYKQPSTSCLDLSITNNIVTTNNPPHIPIKYHPNSSNIDTTLLLTDQCTATNVPTTLTNLTSIADSNPNSLNTTTITMPFATHAIQSPSFITNQACDYTSNKYW